MGDTYEPEIKEWDIIQEKPFEIEQEQFVVCFDSLG